MNQIIIALTFVVFVNSWSLFGEKEINEVDPPRNNGAPMRTLLDDSNFSDLLNDLFNDDDDSDDREKLKHSTIGFLLFDDVQELDFSGPYEMFSMWSIYFGGPSNLITISERGVIRGVGGLKIVTDYGFDNCPKIDYLIIPGGKGTRIQENNPKFMNFLKYSQTKYLLSVCTGSLLLAKAGLLNGLKATTHWASLDDLRQFKDINVIEERVVRNENIWTSGGVSSGIDLALEFISYIDGEEIAGKVQYLSEYYPSNKRYSDISRTHPKAPQYLKQ